MKAWLIDFQQYSTRFATYRKLSDGFRWEETRNDGAFPDLVPYLRRKLGKEFKLPATIGPSSHCEL
jgi:hypothetical protein